MLAPLVMAVGFLLWPMTLRAQVSSPAAADVPPETRVRISTRLTHDAWIGHFVRRDGDTLWLHPAGSTERQFVLRAEVTDFRVSAGQSRRVRRSAWRGFLIGAGAGFALGALASIADPEGAEWFGGQLGATAFMTGFIAVPATIIGTIAGIPRREIWVRVPPP